MIVGRENHITDNGWGEVRWVLITTVKNKDKEEEVGKKLKAESRQLPEERETNQGWIVVNGRLGERSDSKVWPTHSFQQCWVKESDFFLKTGGKLWCQKTSEGSGPLVLSVIYLSFGRMEGNTAWKFTHSNVFSAHHLVVVISYHPLMGQL